MLRKPLSQGRPEFRRQLTEGIFYTKWRKICGPQGPYVHTWQSELFFFGFHYNSFFNIEET